MKTTSGVVFSRSTREKAVRMVEEKHKQHHSCPGLDKNEKVFSTVTSALVQRWKDRRLIAQRDAVKLPGVNRNYEGGLVYNAVYFPAILLILKQRQSLSFITCHQFLQNWWLPVKAPTLSVFQLALNSLVL